MTLGEMKQTIAGEFLETQDTRAGGDPFSIERQIVRAANYVAKRSDCLYGRRVLDLVTGTTQYCATDIYKLKKVQIADDKGAIYDPAHYDLESAAFILGINWQNRTAQTNPDTVLFLGDNGIILSAAPAANRTGALTLFGFCEPGAFWAFTSNGAGYGTPLPLADNQECPLPGFAHDAVLVRAMAYRADSTAGRLRPEIAQQIPTLTARADEMQGTVNKLAALHHARL